MINNTHLLKPNTVYFVHYIKGYIVIDNENYNCEIDHTNLGIDLDGDTITICNTDGLVTHYPFPKGFGKIKVLDKIDIVDSLTSLAIECRSGSKSSMTFNKINSVMNIPEVKNGDEIILGHKLVCDKDLPTTPDGDVEMIFNTTSMLRRDPRFEETEDGFVVSEEFANRIKETDYQRVEVIMNGLEHKLLGFYLKLDIRDNRVKLKCGNKLIPIKVNKRVKKRLKDYYRQILLNVLNVCFGNFSQALLSNKHFEEELSNELFPVIQ